MEKRFSFDPLNLIPFKFGANNLISKPTRNKFDLKASLMRPIKYQPYTGSLKSKPTFKMSVKARTAGQKVAHKRAERVGMERKNARRSRANARHDILMKKRALK